MFFRLLSVVLLLPTLALTDTISLRADSWPPFNDQPGSDHPGYLVEIATQILEKVGHKVDYQIMPWTRSIKEAEAGKIDGIIGAAKDDAPSFIFPNESLGKSDNAFFVRKGEKWRYDEIESIKQITLGYILDYSYDENLDAFLKKNKSAKFIQGISGDNAVQQNINKLKAGRVTAIVESTPVFFAALKDMNLSKNLFEPAGNLGTIQDIYIAFTPIKKSSVGYAKLLSDGIQDLRKSGELKKILDKYGLVDWK